MGMSHFMFTYHRSSLLWYARAEHGGVIRMYEYSLQLYEYTPENGLIRVQQFLKLLQQKNVEHFVF